MNSFTCETCEKTFKRKEHLLSHKTVHEDAKEFVCKLCGSSFKRPNFLLRHIRRTHDKSKEKFQCELCGAKYTLKDNLQRHMKHHHSNEKSVKCIQCNKVLKNVENLSYHIRMAHEAK